MVLVGEVLVVVVVVVLVVVVVEVLVLVVVEVLVLVLVEVLVLVLVEVLVLVLVDVLVLVVVVLTPTTSGLSMLKGVSPPLASGLRCRRPCARFMAGIPAWSPARTSACAKLTPPAVLTLIVHIWVPPIANAGVGPGRLRFVPRLMGMVKSGNPLKPGQ